MNNASVKIYARKPLCIASCQMSVLGSITTMHIGCTEMAAYVLLF